VRRETEASLGAQLAAGARELQVELPDPAQRKLLDYLGELGKWNAAYNLTAVREPAAMVTRHLLDSLALLPFVSAGRALDVGSGAGLPGIPLAIARPALAVALLDSNGKKARFLRHAQRALDLANVEVIEARAEGLRPDAPFDAVLARAFGSLAEFLLATAHLGAPGAHWLAMKGKLDDKELKDLPKGFVVKDVIPLKVPGLDEARHLIRVVR